MRQPPATTKHKLAALQPVLENRTAKSAQVLREILGPIRLEPVAAEIGRQYLRAHTALDALALVETAAAETSADGGSLLCSSGDGGN